MISMCITRLVNLLLDFNEALIQEESLGLFFLPFIPFKKCYQGRLVDFNSFYEVLQCGGNIF